MTDEREDEYERTIHTTPDRPSRRIPHDADRRITALQDENARLRDVIDGITSDLEKIVRRDKFSKSAPRPLTAEEMRDKAVEACEDVVGECDLHGKHWEGNTAWKCRDRVAALSTMKEDGDGD